MNLKHFLLPVIAVGLGGSLLAQTPASSPSPGAEEGGWHHGGGWHHHHGGWLFKKLNLDDQQRQQLKSLRASSRADFRAALVAYLQAKVDLETAISQNATDLSGPAANLATAQNRLLQLRVQREQQFVSILHPDQLQTWKDIHQKKAARLQERINDLNGQ
jgi:Spy/CpxP family protein refolding chaperone